MNKELDDTNTDDAIIRNQNLTTRMNSTDSMNNTIIIVQARIITHMVLLAISLQ